MAHQQFGLGGELVQAAVGGVVELGRAPEPLRQSAARTGQRVFIGAVQGHQHQARHQSVAQLRDQQPLLRRGGRRKEGGEIGFDAHGSRRKQGKRAKAKQGKSVPRRGPGGEHA